MIDGHMEDNGRFPGTIKLAGEGGMLKPLVRLGEEKSSISSFRIIPVLSEAKPAPKLKKNLSVTLHHAIWFISDYNYIDLKIPQRIDFC